MAKMKEQLESNLITKFAAGLMEHDEEQIMQEWLQQNPQFVSTVALIQQQVEAMNQEPVLVSTHP
jgi:anti-sigma factor RsiW